MVPVAMETSMRPIFSRAAAKAGDEWAMRVNARVATSKFYRAVSTSRNAKRSHKTRLGASLAWHVKFMVLDTAPQVPT